jgi:RNase P subunit RPR2
MEPVLSTVLATLLALGLGGGGLLMYQRINRRLFLEHERLLSAWRKLGQTTSLTYTPGIFRWLKGQPATLAGSYRGHQVKLDTFIRNVVDEKTYPFTRIVLTVNPAVAAELHQATDETPIAAELIARLTLADRSTAKWPIQTRANGHQLYYEQRHLATDANYLQLLLDILSNQADAHAQLLALGGEAMPSLQELSQVSKDPKMRETAIQLMRGIAAKTSRELNRLSAELFCPRCLSRFGGHELQLSRREQITFFGCRHCQQSRDYRQGQLVVVIDERMEADILEQQGVFRVNWLKQRTLFDFDAIEINVANDETVERFAVQAGNDTDPLRRSRYPHLPWSIASTSRLSENSRRILGRIFGPSEGSSAGTTSA